MSQPLPLRVLLALVPLAVACSPSVPQEQGAPGAVRSPVVYGDDHRLDVYAHPDATLRARAEQSTVALMVARTLDTTDPTHVTFKAPTLQEEYGLCSTERFLQDPTAAFCSGTLIDDDLVLTAGHCVDTAVKCADIRFVFNYYRTSATTLQTVTQEDVFACASVVVRKLGKANGLDLDYAIVRLDRPATPRFTPAPVRREASALEKGARLAVIGSGSGIPFKVEAGGTVRDARATVLDYFVGTTDTFSGNSGSAVYALSDYSVAGILVRGEGDYVPSGSCAVPERCSETGCRGEDSTYVHQALEDYCKGDFSERLCGTVRPSHHLVLLKTVVNLHGVSHEAKAGDELEYTLTTVNDGALSVGDVVLEDALPAELAYEEGSLRLTTDAGTGPRTDAPGDDAVEYVADGHRLVVRLGSGASASQGGQLASFERATVVFRARVKEGVIGPVANQATVTAAGLTAGEEVRSDSAPGRGAAAGPTTVTALPVPPTFVSPAQGAVVMDATPTFSGTGLVGSGVEVALQGGGVLCRVAEVPAGGAWACEAGVSLPDGFHSVDATTLHPSGYASQPAELFFQVDSVAPDTRLTFTPPAQSSSRSASFDLGASEPKVTYACSVNGAPFTACTSPLVLTGLEDGTYTLRVQATDAAGHVDATPASYTWTVDTRAPETSLEATFPAPASASFTFASPEAGASFHCRLDEAPFAWCTSPVRFDGLSVGAHRFEVRAVDVAGNRDATPASTPWTVEPDADGDGLTPSQEQQHGTDPARADTDGDGVSDGQEVARGTDPLAAPATGEQPKGGCSSAGAGGGLPLSALLLALAPLVQRAGGARPRRRP